MYQHLIGRSGPKFFAAFLLAFVITSCNKNDKNVKPVTNSLQPGKFNLNAAGDHADFVITNYASNRVLEIGGTSVDNGGTADQAAYQGTTATFANQKWKLTDQGNGYCKMMNLRSGKYLELAAGNTVIQDQSTTSDAQLWAVTQVAAGGYKIISKQSGQALTVQNGSTSDGAAIITQNYTDGNDAQRWWFAIIAPEAYRDDDVTRFFQRTSGSEAFDGGASVPLPTGQVLWVTNDVYYNQLLSNGEFRCGQIFNYHNSLLIQPASHSWDPAQTVNVLSPDGVQIFRAASGKLLWPGAGIFLGTHAYVHNIEVPLGSLSATNQYLCDITAAGDGKSANTVTNLTVPGMSGQTDITYAIGMVKASDGYVYAYGAGGFVGANVYVARFPQTNPTAWTFWNGSTWASSPTTASAAAVTNGPINNNTVGYVNGKYVCIEMDFGFSCDATGRNVYVSTSSSPTGPFTARKLVYQLPDIKQGHRPVYYNPTIHAEFDNGQNELLVNYCVNFYSKNDGTNAKCLVDCSNPDGTEDPNDYRPKGIRIPYSLMGL